MCTFVLKRVLYKNRRAGNGVNQQCEWVVVGPNVFRVSVESRRDLCVLFYIVVH